MTAKRKRQAISIPSDWNGNDWFCIKLSWPKSPEWISILVGMLSQPSRGRWWDGDTGVVVDAQSVGEEIFQRNIGFSPCGVCDCDTDSEGDCTGECSGGAAGAAAAYWQYLTERARKMGVLDIKIVDGVLWKRLLPCCEWVEVGNIGRLVEEVNPDDTPPPAEPPADIACRKADSMVSILQQVAAVGWENKASFVYDWANNLKSTFPFLEMSTWRLYEAYNYLLAGNFLSILTPWVEQFGYVETQALKCAWYSLLSTTSNTLSMDEFNAMQSAIKNQTSGFKEQYLEALMNAIGKSGMSWVAAGSLTNESANCDCPGIVSDPADDLPEWLTWSYSIDLRNSLPAWLELEEETEHVPGLGVVDYPSETGFMKPKLRIIPQAWPVACDIEAIAMRWWNAATNDYQGTKCVFQTGAAIQWEGTDPDTNPSSGGTFYKLLLLDYSPNPPSDYVRWEVQCRSVYDEDPAYTAVIQWIIVAGTGEDPQLG